MVERETPKDGKFVGEILVDGHVHFHTCFDRNTFLNAAIRNLHRSLRNPQNPWLGILCFTEDSGSDAFADFESSTGDNNSGWTIYKTAEDCSLIARTDGSPATLVIVAGRQVRTSEGLEVLGLGLRGEVNDGMPLTDSIREVANRDAIPVVPWGFGKWWFSRGETVRSVLQDEPTRFFLGDNGSRTAIVARSTLFLEGSERGAFDLPGTDPMPFDAEEGRVGSYGFQLGTPIGLTRPAADLKQNMKALTKQPNTFGNLQSLLRFSKLQVLMQLRKFQGNRSS